MALPPKNLLMISWNLCFAATIIYRGCTWKGRVMDCSVGGTNGASWLIVNEPYSYGKTTTGYFLRKLLDETD